MLPKWRLYHKMLQIKVVENKIPNKKLIERICLSSPGVKLGALKIAMFEII